MGLITLYARKEPTTDAIALSAGVRGRQDAVLYRDRECTQLAVRWPWHYSSCPRRGQRRVMLNCYRWQLEWLN